MERPRRAMARVEDGRRDLQRVLALVRDPAANVPDNTLWTDLLSVAEAELAKLPR